jgi:hypothetical protein
MRLENVISLTHATLLNSPYVSAFNGIAIEAKNVKRGFLFIAKESTEIELAIQNGAYGILFDSPTQISDTEIAWIKVENLETALVKIVRFHLLDKNITAYECDAITFDLAIQISTDTRFITLSGNIFTIFNDLWEVTQNSVILFHSNLSCKNIFTHPHLMPQKTEKKITIIEQTLFETSFIYDNIYYERALLSPFFIPYLEILLELLKLNNIEFKIISFKNIHHFEPLFTNKEFEIKEFGTSDKVLIFEPDFKLADIQISFLKEQASWANIIYIIPKQRAEQIEELENIYTYTTQLDIIAILKTTNFHFALIAEQDRSLIETNVVPKKQIQLTLDFD